MPELSSELEASQFQLIPNGPQTAHVIKVDATDPTTGKVKTTKSGEGRMCTMDWIIEGGDHADKEVRFDNLMLGGNYKDEKSGQLKPLNTAPLCQFLTHTSVPWNCNSCNNPRSARKFYIGTGDDGCIKGKYYCPDCKNSDLKIGYNTDTFMGARCRIIIGSQKGQKDPDKEFNSVKGYLPLE